MLSLLHQSSAIHTPTMRSSESWRFAPRKRDVSADLIDGVNARSR